MNIRKILLFAMPAIMYNLLTNASPLSVTYGGTGLSSTTANAVLTTGTSSLGPMQPVASAGTSGQVLRMTSSSTIPAFATVREYGYVYSKANQTVTTGSSYLFEFNGPLSSGISHSTSSNTDQITINTTGIYWFMWVSVSLSTSIYASLTVNGASNTATRYRVTPTAQNGAGICILSITAGDIVRVTNWSGGSVGCDGTSTRISVALVIRQVS